MKKLIATTDEFRQYVTGNATLDIEVLAPHIRATQQKYILPILGKTLYDELLDAYDDETGEIDEGPLKDLLPYVQAPLAKFAIAEAVSELQLNISNSGLRRAEDESNKTAYQYQINDFKADKFLQAYDDTDILISFLEENIEDYESWEDSDAFTDQKSYIINKAEEFSSYVNIKRSRQTFIALLPVQKKVEDFFIKTALGDDLYSRIKSEIASTITDQVKELLNYMKPAVAHFTIAKAIGDLPLEIRADGFWVNSIQANMQNSQQKKPAGDDLLYQKAKAMNADGEQYMRNLITYLNANATGSVYPEWYNSALYTAPDDDTTGTPFKTSSTETTFSAL